MISKIKFLSIVLLLNSIVFITSCKENSGNTEYIEENIQSFYNEEQGYSDGEYCAEIEYYNPRTGTRSTYTLNVEVENNELTVIHWPNGGWLDNSHFSSEELDSNGYCSFTSDSGYEYEVQIKGSPCSYTDDYEAIRDTEDDAEATTCPQCGDEKDSYDDLCYSCKRKNKDIEEHTCKRCGEYDSFMWSSDELCSDCKREVEEE